MKRFLMVLFLCFSQSLWASIETYEFNTQQQTDDYKELINELRCLVCQNQNLADSNAELAQDLRKQVHFQLVEKQANKQQVVDFMVARYGEFVLYKPPVQSNTLALWIGPIIFLLLGLWVVFNTVRKAKNAHQGDKQ